MSGWNTSCSRIGHASNFSRSLVLVLLAASCAVPPHPGTVAEHERLAQHYTDTADSIETECWKARRNEDHVK